MKLKMISITINEDSLKAIDEIAKQLRMSRSAFLEKAGLEKIKTEKTIQEIIEE